MDSHLHCDQYLLSTIFSTFCPRGNLWQYPMAATASVAFADRFCVVPREAIDHSINRYDEKLINSGRC